MISLKKIYNDFFICFYLDLLTHGSTRVLNGLTILFIFLFFSI